MRYGSFCTVSNAKKMEAFHSFRIRCVYVKKKIVCVTAKQKKCLKKFEPANRKKSKSGSFEQKQEITSDL